MNRKQGSTPHYVPAAEYVSLAGLPISGRTLQRWCDDNPTLAEGVGEFSIPGKRLYDASTATSFREVWFESVKTDE